MTHRIGILGLLAGDAPGSARASAWPSARQELAMFVRLSAVFFVLLASGLGLVAFLL